MNMKNAELDYGLHYYDALESAKQAAERDHMPPVVFRLISAHGWGGGCYCTLTEVTRAALNFSYDLDNAPVYVERQTGGEDSPWVRIRRIKVTSTCIDPEVPATLPEAR
jgi:hypothetical protein